MIISIGYAGSPNAIKLDDIPSLDQLVQNFYSISINRESTPAMMQKHKSIVPFVHTPAIMQESNAIVPFGRLQGFNSKALVTFEPPKKRKPRAKVDLDPETDRVWNLLMGKESDHGVEGTDVDKEKWWEEERRVFRGRTDSFIARMHLIQGTLLEVLHFSVAIMLSITLLINGMLVPRRQALHEMERISC